MDIITISMLDLVDAQLVGGAHQQETVVKVFDLRGLGGGRIPLDELGNSFNALLIVEHRETLVYRA